MLRSASKQLAAYMRDNSEKLAAQIQAGVVNQLSRRAGVLCLAGAKDNLKMWAHYAKSHRGFLLEFNTESPSFRDLGHVYPVNYSPRRPVCDPLDLVGISWCITKGMEWEEEHEFRIIREFRHCVEVEQNGRPIRVCPLPKDAIKAVYLGVNMAASDRDRVIGSVRGTNIQILQTKLPREVFGLEFQSLG